MPIILIDYSEKAIAVYGDTKTIDNELLALGGKFNLDLNINKAKQPGWIFSKKHRAKVETFLGSFLQPQTKAVKQSCLPAKWHSPQDLRGYHREHGLSQKELFDGYTRLQKYPPPAAIKKRKFYEENEALNVFEPSQNVFQPSQDVFQPSQDVFQPSQDVFQPQDVFQGQLALAVMPDVLQQKQNDNQICARKVLYKPSDFTSDRDVAMYAGFRKMGYEILERGIDFDKFRKFIKDTDKKNGEATFCTQKGSFVMPTSYFRVLLKMQHPYAAKNVKAIYRYYYILVCYNELNEPLSALVYGYGTPSGQLVIEAVCANQQTLENPKRVKGTGKALIKNLCHVADLIQAKVKLDAVPSAVGMYIRLGFQKNHERLKSMYLSTIMIRPYKKYDLF